LKREIFDERRDIVGPYDEEKAAEDTDSSAAETRAAWHDARTDDQLSDDSTIDYGDREPTYSEYDSSWEDE